MRDIMPDSSYCHWSHNAWVRAEPLWSTGNKCPLIASGEPGAHVDLSKEEQNVCLIDTRIFFLVACRSAGYPVSLTKHTCTASRAEDLLPGLFISALILKSELLRLHPGNSLLLLGETWQF